jgi:hypothetical protein
VKVRQRWVSDGCYLLSFPKFLPFEEYLHKFSLRISRYSAIFRSQLFRALIPSALFSGALLDSIPVPNLVISDVTLLSPVRKGSKPITFGTLPFLLPSKPGYNWSPVCLAYCLAILAILYMLVSCSVDLYPEDGGDTLLRSISSHTNYTEIYYGIWTYTD